VNALVTSCVCGFKITSSAFTFIHHCFILSKLLLCIIILHCMLVRLQQTEYFAHDLPLKLRVKFKHWALNINWMMSGAILYRTPFSTKNWKLCVLVVYIHNNGFGVLKTQTFENWFWSVSFANNTIHYHLCVKQCWVSYFKKVINY